MKKYQQLDMISLTKAERNLKEAVSWLGEVEDEQEYREWLERVDREARVYLESLRAVEGSSRGSWKIPPAGDDRAVTFAEADAFVAGYLQGAADEEER